MQKIYTVKEVANVLKVDVHIVYNLIKHGDIKAIKIGSLKITENELDKYINKLV